MLLDKRVGALPCPREGLSPPEPHDLNNLMNSFLPERADTGRNGKEFL